MKPLVVIPARAGSKGVPGKNIKKLAGKPLLHYTIDAAMQVFCPEIICVSTDSEEIKACAEAAGLQVPFLRPSVLATDTCGTRDVLLHAITYYQSTGYDPDTLVLLQPTSPFRSAKHISEGLELFSLEIDMVVSVKETKSNPYFTLFEEYSKGFLTPSKKASFNRRQDCPKIWEFNGAIYIINIDSLSKSEMRDFSRIMKYEMDERSSHDIDTQLDWLVAEMLVK